MLELLIGLGIGSIGTYKLIHTRINDYKYFAESRLTDYKESFQKGFETTNGYTPFKEETTQTEERVAYTEETYEQYTPEYEETKRERWDD